MRTVDSHPRLRDAVRLAALDATGLAGTPPEAAFDRYAALARDLLGASAAFVSLVDATHVHFKSAIAAADRTMPPRVANRDSLCPFTVVSGTPLVVADSRATPDLAGHPAVRDFDLIAYAGVPLVSDDQVIGTFCVIDDRPRGWTPADVRILQDLCHSVSTEIALRGRVARLEEAAAQQRETARDLSNERVLLRTVLATAPVGFALVDPALRYLMINERLAQMNGLPVDAHIGRRIGEIVPSLAAQAREAVDLVQRTGQPVLGREFGGETPLAPGVPRHWSADWYPVHRPDGELVGVAVIVGEITERKASSERLEAASRHKDRFLAMLSHELRSPLAPIRNAVEILRLRAPADPAISGLNDLIGRQVGHLTRLVDDLLDVSRVSQGKIALRTAPVDLARAVDAGVELARAAVDARRHRLVVSLDVARPCTVSGDPARLAQVVSNLIDNAAKYTDPGGRIDVTLEADDRHARLVVADDGPGIDPLLLPHLFELFTQADQSLDRAQGGLGIGLALVRSLVELHGGTVAAASEGKGSGSRFTVTLPLSREPSAEPPGAPGAQRSASRRVLVVDDNADAAESMCLLLQLQGHEVERAGDGPAAIARAETFRPDVCVLDIGLPGMDGYALARHLRAMPSAARARYIALTGYGRPEDRALALDAGFDQHLVKPVEPGALQAAIAAR
ncbi:MAG: ATP-binding protein [Lautropia sp.]